METIMNFLRQTGFSMIGDNWKMLVMIAIALVLAYLAIVKKFEPLLLLPISFGMLLTNLPGANLFHEELFAGEAAHFFHTSLTFSGRPELLSSAPEKRAEDIAAVLESTDAGKAEEIRIAHCGGKDKDTGVREICRTECQGKKWQ